MITKEVVHSCGHLQSHGFWDSPAIEDIAEFKKRPCAICCLSPSVRVALIKSNARRSVNITTTREGWNVETYAFVNSDTNVTIGIPFDDPKDADECAALLRRALDIRIECDETDESDPLDR